MRKSAGYEKFDTFVQKNNMLFQRQLVVQMMNTGESLEWVLDQIIAGKQLGSSNKSNAQRMTPQSLHQISMFEQSVNMYDSITPRKSIHSP